MSKIPPAGPDAPPPDPAAAGPRSSGDRRDVPADAPAEAPEAEPATPKAGHAGGFTLDLSSGPTAGQPEAWRRKRKQASPILTKIVDLTAPKPEPAPPRQGPPPKAEAKPQAHAKPPREKQRDEARGRGRKPGGATLADLLDEETLARLRGDE